MITWREDKPVREITDYDSLALFQEGTGELIQPVLSRWDKYSLWQKFVKDMQKVAKSSDSELQKLVHGRRDWNQYRENLKKVTEEIQKKMPKYVLYDSFNLFNTPHDQMKMAKFGEDQRWWFDTMKDHMNNTYMKMLCANNSMYSYMMSSAILKRIFVQAADPNTPNGGNNQGGGSGGIENIMEGMSSQDMQNIMNDAQEEVEKDIDDMEKMNKAMGKGFNPADLSFAEVEHAMKLWEELKHYPISNEAVTKFIKTTLKLSESYFSSQYTENEIELIETDNVEDLLGLENLMDPLDKFHLDDLVTHERKYHMKFDVYVDLSGSMNSGAMHSGGRRISKDDLAKITALKLKLGGHVEEVYGFDTRLHGPFKSIQSFLRARLGGGTTTDRALENIIKTGRPGLIITDACDSVRIYTEWAYFIGISGSDFTGYSHCPAGKRFLSNSQCILHHPKTNAFTKAAPGHLSVSVDDGYGYMPF